MESRRNNRADWQPELRTLRYFVCVAEEKSLTAAASRLRIAQPALSRQIRQLEDGLGTPVFRRTPRGVELTEAGAILLGRAYSILAQVQQAHHDVTAQVRAPRGVVVVGMPPTPGEFIAPPLLARVMANFPQIELRFVEAFSRDLERRLIQGEIGLVVMHDPPVRDDIVISRLLDEHLYVIGPTGAIDREAYTLVEAARLPLVLPSRPNTLRILVDKHADAGNLPLNIVQRADGIWLLKALVRNGHGFTLLTYGAVTSEVRQGTLAAAPLVDPRIDWTLCTATRTDQHGKMAVRVVENSVRTIVQDLVARGIWK